MRNSDRAQPGPAAASSIYALLLRTLDRRWLRVSCGGSTPGDDLALSPGRRGLASLRREILRERVSI